MIEINLGNLLEKAKSKKKVLVHRSGKTFYREQEVGKKDAQQIKHAINKAQSEHEKLRQKMNGMIDKYYDGEKISPENKKKIDNIENQMRGVQDSITAMRKKYEKITVR